MSLPEKSPQLYSPEIYDAVDAAVYAALEYDDEPAIRERNVGSPIVGEAAAELDDMAILEDPANYRETVPADTLVVWDTRGEMRAGLRALEDIMYYVRVYGIGSEWYDKVARHEAAHASAARARNVGFSVVKMGIHTYPQPDGPRVGFRGVCTHARPNRPISKLAMASVIIAPADPSTDQRLGGGDVGKIRAMGYEDVPDVVERIRFFNARNPHSALPLPENFA